MFEIFLMGANKQQPKLLPCPPFFVEYICEAKTFPTSPGSAAPAYYIHMLIFKVSGDFCVNFRSHFAFGSTI